ncbi:MAG: SGNH/GDSL hydrolase family protein [Acidobacteriaceae bacterium]
MHFLPPFLKIHGRTRNASYRLAAGFFALAMATVLLTAPASYAAQARSSSPWVATWGAAMVAESLDSAPDVSGKTIREIVPTSVGGGHVRIWLSNRFGAVPLHIGAVHIAISRNGSAGVYPDGRQDLSADGSAIQAGSDRTLTFNGTGSIVIPPGAEVVSDSVALDVPALSDMAISIYLPDHTMMTTEHSGARQISYAATGNMTNTPDLAGKDWRVHSWYFLSGMDVEAPGDSAVVAIGDSITDGTRSTENENHRWPNYLATRLAADAATKKAGVLGVVDVGIGGNRVLLDGHGPNAVSRINPDIVARSNAKYVIVLESINDIARFTTDDQPYRDLVQHLESGIAQLAAQAHQHGMKVFGATLTPYQGCGCYSEEGEAVRAAVNQWIRTSPVFDGVVDFDKAVRDPENPLHYLVRFDSGDHVHPNDTGYKAMADSIDLNLFTATAATDPTAH